MTVEPTAGSGAIRERQLLVRATGLGEWPGTDPMEAIRAVRGELGDPHLPFLPALPHRGPGSDPAGRSAAILREMAVDLQPHGWRLVPRPGREHRRAESALSSDINALGDVAGAEERPANRLKVHFLGPLSLAAQLHLHGGERVLLDIGARRETYASLAVGAADLVTRLAAVSRGAGVEVQVDEPDVGRVLSGTIPTASGYRTLRALDRKEATDAWSLMHAAVTAAGAVGMTLSLPADDRALDAALSSPVESYALRVSALSDRHWESLAEALESGGTLWAGIMGPEPDVPQVSTLVQRILLPWHRVGLPLSMLRTLTLTPDQALAGANPATSTRVLSRLVQTAEALNQVMDES